MGSSDRRRRDDRTHDRKRRDRSESRDRSRRRKKKDKYDYEATTATTSTSKQQDEEVEDEPQSALSLTNIMKENPNLTVGEALAKLQIMKQMTGMNPVPTMPGGAPIPQGQGLPVPQPGVMQMIGMPALQGITMQGGGMQLLQSMGSTEAPSSTPLQQQQQSQMMQMMMTGPKVAQENLLHSKPQRELYFGPLPAGCTGPQLQTFMGAALEELGVPQGAINTTWLGASGEFGFCELRGVEETKTALKLNGIDFAGSKLRIGRPKPVPGSTAAGKSAALHLMNNQNPAVNPFMMSSNVLMLTNLPKHLDSGQIRELLVPFGELKEMNLLKDAEGKSKGTVIFNYVESKIVPHVVSIFNDVRMGDLTLSVQRVPPQMIPTLMEATSTKRIGAAPAHDSEKQSPVVVLRNLVNVLELSDDEQYAELTDEILEECNSYGGVESMEIPRPDPAVDSYLSDNETFAGIGSVFVHFGDVLAAEEAIACLQGRSFEGRVCHASYYPLELYNQRVFDSPPLPLVLRPLPDHIQQPGLLAAATEDLEQNGGYINLPAQLPTIGAPAAAVPVTVNLPPARPFIPMMTMPAAPLPAAPTAIVDESMD